MAQKNYLVENLVWGAVLAVGAWWYFSSGKPAEKKEPEAVLSQEEQDALCAKTLNCWASKWEMRASADCRQPVERLAKNDFEWTNGWAESRLPRALWLSESQKTLTYVGDTIKFQNGFGGWIAHTYECDYDPRTRSVLAVRAQQGRL